MDILARMGGTLKTCQNHYRWHRALQVADEPLQCAGAVILDDDGRVFVQRRSPQRRLFPNCWDIVGGHLEDGESFDEALRREITEETGWRIAVVLGPVGEFSYRGDDGRDRVEQDFLVRVDGDLARPRLEEGRHTEWRWVTEAELAQLLAEESLGHQLLREVVAAGFATARRFGLLP
jgi:8-oxo-dGTP pyrophosphatase MutT (NUDIX family)